MCVLTAAFSDDRALTRNQEQKSVVEAAKVQKQKSDHGTCGLCRQDFLHC